MSILEQGCTCESCMYAKKRNLKDARERWGSGKREIILNEYNYTCGDGCCSDYGTIVYVNGFQISSDGENVESVILSLMEFLGIENVNVNFDYDNEK